MRANYLVRPFRAWLVLLSALGALAGCGDDANDALPTLDPDQLQLVGGPVACDSCSSATLELRGRGVEEVVAAAIVRPGEPQAPVSTSALIRHVTSGPEP